MRVMVLVKATKDSEAGRLPGTELLEAMGRFNEELMAAGLLQAGDGLRPSAEGARVRFAGAERSVVRGPFGGEDPGQVLAGFWIWQVNSLEEAIDWVRRCPNPHESESEIEIRPLYEIEDFGEQATPEVREREARLAAELAGGPEGAVRAHLEAFAQAIAARDAAAVVALFAPDSVEFSLAPPLVVSTGQAEALEGWFGTWQGPLGYSLRDLEVEAGGGSGGPLAFAHCLTHLTGTKRDGEEVDLWFRQTFGLKRGAEGWRIHHAHESVPFYMDGSYRAATDLKPAA